MVEWANVIEHSYDQLDDLLKEIRLNLAPVRKSDPETGNKLKDLLRQLEIWVESLVVDSLKLKSLEGELQRRKEMAKVLRESLDKKSETGSDKPPHPISE
ncbi:hypothetical protein ACFLYR_02110 [Chloroflexota bacterium]